LAAEPPRRSLLLVLAAVVDAHKDAELDELVELLQRDAPDAGQLLGGLLLGLRAIAPAIMTQLACLATKSVVWST